VLYAAKQETAMIRRMKQVALLSIFLVALFTLSRQPGMASLAQGPTTVYTPLIDMGSKTYLGFSGGLYPGTSNALPGDHLKTGLRRAQVVRPLGVNGNPSGNGKYVLLSLGMSNTSQEFCSWNGVLPCRSWSFMGQAAADGSVNKTRLVIVNGARPGRSIPFWDSPTDPDYDRVRDAVLSPQGLSEKQVQVIWLKNANSHPTVSLRSTSADAYHTEKGLGKIVRAAKVRYPNLQQVFISSRIYGGYATTTLSPEPYAYESGLAVKWLIEAQINQTRNGAIDPRAGDLNYTTPAPWIAWGPYLWADGAHPRSDGLVWLQQDFDAEDGIHPSPSGERKVGNLLLIFFKSSSVTKCWFVIGGTCP